MVFLVAGRGFLVRDRRRGATPRSLRPPLWSRRRKNLAAPPPDPDATVRLAYQSAERAGTKKSWEDFVAKYPSGRYAELARQQIAKLAPPAAPAAPVDDPAIKELDKKIELNPNDAAAYYKRGQLYAQHGDFARAVKDFDEVIRLNPKDVEGLNNRCWARAMIGELQPALKDCDAALEIRPRYLDALDSRGFVNLKLGQPKNAIADYDAALRINPKHASSLYGRGIAKMRTGNAAGGNGDIAAAKLIQPDIADEFASYGIPLIAGSGIEPGHGSALHKVLANERGCSDRSTDRHGTVGRHCGSRRLEHPQLAAARGSDHAPCSSCLGGLAGSLTGYNGYFPALGGPNGAALRSDVKVAQPWRRNIPTVPAVFVAIDDASLSSPELAALPRALFQPVWARLIDGLLEAGARRIAFDVVFAYAGADFQIGAFTLPDYDRSLIDSLEQGPGSHRSRAISQRFAGASFPQGGGGVTGRGSRPAARIGWKGAKHRANCASR